MNLTPRRVAAGARGRATRGGQRAAEVGLATLNGLVATLWPAVAVAARARTQMVGRMDYSRRDIHLAVESAFELGVRLRSCAKEPETIAWIEANLRHGDVLYDVGANVGPYALVAAKWADGKAKVFAFEPAFPTFAQLCRNVMLNRCEDCVVPLPVALSDQTQLSVLNYSAREGVVAGSALHSVGVSVDEEGRPFTPAWRQPLLCYRLDDMVRAFGLPVPNHLKLDVDGQELAILRGASVTLADPGVRTLLVEMNERLSAAAEIVALLARHGFVPVSRHAIRDRMCNVIFARERGR